MCLYIYIYLERATTATFSVGPCCPLFYGTVNEINTKKTRILVQVDQMTRVKSGRKISLNVK